VNFVFSNSSGTVKPVTGATFTVANYIKSAVIGYLIQTVKTTTYLSLFVQTPGQGEFSLNGPVTNSNVPVSYTQVGRIYTASGADAAITVAWVNAAKAARQLP